MATGNESCGVNSNLVNKITEGNQYHDVDPVEYYQNWMTMIGNQGNPGPVSYTHLWIQNRAFTLAIWCMFAQCVPAFQDYSVFSVQSVNNPNVNLAVSVIALLANIAAFAYIMYRAKKLKVNPYMNEVFAGTKDYDKAMARRATPAELAES